MDDTLLNLMTFIPQLSPVYIASPAGFNATLRKVGDSSIYTAYRYQVAHLIRLLCGLWL